MTGQAVNSFRVHLHGGENASGTGLLPLGGSFEELSDRLSGFPLAQVELDGAFVVRVMSSGCQIDGMIYDLAGVVQYIELVGRATQNTWLGLIESLCNDLSKVSCQNLKTGRVSSVAEFQQSVWE